MACGHVNIFLLAREGHTAYGYMEGDVFHLERFPVDKSDLTDWLELDHGGVECHQTMGHIDLVLPMPPTREPLREEDVTVEVSSWQLRVSAALDGEAPQQVPLSLSISAMPSVSTRSVSKPPVRIFLATQIKH